MIPFLVLEQITAIYGQDLPLPKFIDLRVFDDTRWQGSEHDLQKNFFAYLGSLMIANPVLYLAHAIPNGGNRNRIEASRLKAEGVTSGIPDVFIPIPKQGWSGLYIEFKRDKEKPTDDQRAVLLMLDNQGYKVIVCNSLEVAKEQFDAYFYGATITSKP